MPIAIRSPLFRFSILLSVLALTIGAVPTANASQEDGRRVLFMGHSFFKPFAEGMPVHTERAGITEHTQVVVFSGGSGGAPMALWNNASKRAQIQAALDTGEIESFVMTYEPTYPTTEGYERWFNYALDYNPGTRFHLGIPWLDFPQNYSDEDYINIWMAARDTLWQDLIGSLRELYPDSEISTIPYGQSAIELRRLWADGNLPGINLTGNASSSIFTDAKGHPGDILRDLGQLVWIDAIYAVDLLNYSWNHGWSVDLQGIAHDIVEEYRDKYGPEPEIAPIRSTRFSLKDDGTVPIDPRKRRLSFRSSAYRGSASGVIAPQFGSDGDPTSAGESGGGAKLTIYSSGGNMSAAVELDLAAARWQRSGSAARPGYRYKDSNLTDGPISKVSLRNGTLTISGKGAGLYTLENAPQGEMALRLQLGSGEVLCGSAEAKSPASKHDSVARFTGLKNSPQPDLCPPLNPGPYGSASAAFLSTPTSLLD
jgi:hypothetical protein